MNLPLRSEEKRGTSVGRHFGRGVFWGNLFSLLLDLKRTGQTVGPGALKTRNRFKVVFQLQHDPEATTWASPDTARLEGWGPKPYPQLFVTHPSLPSPGFPTTSTNLGWDRKKWTWSEGRNPTTSWVQKDSTPKSLCLSFSRSNFKHRILKLQLWSKS